MLGTIKEKVAGKKTISLMIVAIVVTVLGWSEGKLDDTTALVMVLAELGLITLKTGDNRSENRIKDLLDKLGMVLVLALPMLVLTGCPSTQIHSEIVALRAHHKTFREHTVAKPGVDAAKVDKLGKDIDAAFGKMEKLTR